MKKIHLLGLATVATLVFGAFAAMSASAETTLLAEWLITGAAVITLTSVETPGIIEFVNKSILGTIHILCQGSFDGTVGPGGEGEITEVLQEGLPQTIDCTGDTICLGLVEVWPENLPWLSRLVLMENGTFLKELFQGTPATTKPAYHVHCVSLGLESLCENAGSVLMENGTTDVIDKIILEVITCANGTTGEREGEGLTVTLNGNVLAVSSE